MVLYPNKLPESERVCSGICRYCFSKRFLLAQKVLLDFYLAEVFHIVMEKNRKLFDYHFLNIHLKFMNDI